MSFSGPGAQIYRAEIYGASIGAILTSGGSLGIIETDITADRPTGGAAAIGRVEADGPGIIDCWIGANAFIMPGANLGEGTIVSAGSVVGGKAVPPYKILAGNPARVIGSREPIDPAPPEQDTSPPPGTDTND